MRRDLSSLLTRGGFMNKKTDFGDNLWQYRSMRMKKRGLLLVFLLITVILTVTDLCTGASGMTPVELVRALFGGGAAEQRMIVWRIRMPRVLAALGAGCGLALSGCVMQNVLRNPMASPSTLGVSNAAVLGANVAIILFGAGSFHSTHGSELTLQKPGLVTACAFLFALGATALVLLLSGRHRFSAETVVLAGVALGALCSAGTTVLQYMAMDTQVAAAVFWTFGNLGRASFKESLLLIGVSGVCFVYFFVRGRAYDAMGCGEESARSLGVPTGRVRCFTLLLASLLCAVCVSFLGIIGFVGLIAPQLARRMTGAGHRYLLPATALTGASLLLFSDTLSRLLPFRMTLPVGAVTSLFGAPVFLLLLLRGRKEGVRR